MQHILKQKVFVIEIWLEAIIQLLKLFNFSVIWLID